MNINFRLQHLLFFLFLVIPFFLTFAANPDGDLRIEILSAYNLVVDNNIKSSRPTGPSSFFIGAKVCNDGTNDLEKVFVTVGNYIDGLNDTPGIYPIETTDEAALGYTYSGDFSLVHTADLSDATRFVGTIAAGECVSLYWLVEYPRFDSNGNPVTGGQSDQGDDLQIAYDIWATATDGATPLAADASRTVTCRSMISAMANKIWPNGDNKVPDAYKAAIQSSLGWDVLNSAGGSTICPGENVLSLEGIWYDLGNINQGFDNDGDFVPDYNAWMQPVGEPDFYDPNCFRLVRTFGLLIIKLKGGGEYLIPFEDQLYFQNIPENTGGVGLVYYEFVALDGPCTAYLTPFQEVASGRENEKYNGDFGDGRIPGAEALAPTIDLDKSNSPAYPTSLPATLTYTLAFTNSAVKPIGQPEFGLPLVVQDSVPNGTVYIAGSAASGNTLPSGVSNYTILYSTDNRISWSQDEPSTASDVTDIQWWLSDAIPGSTGGNVTFQVTIPLGYSNPMVINTGYLSFGSNDPFDSDTAQAWMPGLNSISGTVFADDGGTTGTEWNVIQDGDESGISTVTVTLYADIDKNGFIGEGDVVWGTTSTNGSGAYSFSGLPDGFYIALVDEGDSDIPTGYVPSTGTSIRKSLDPEGATTAAVNMTDVDFGFGPTIRITKSLTSTNPAFEGQEVTFDLTVENLIPGSPIPDYPIYWSDKGTGFLNIRKADLDGSNDELVLNSIPSPVGIAIDEDGGKIYYANSLDFGSGTIERSNLDGTSREVLVTGLSVPKRIDLDIANGKMYWGGATSGTMFRANLDGTGLESFIPGGSRILGLAYNPGDGKIYYGDQSYGLYRIDFNGTPELLIAGLNKIEDIELDLVNNKIYWVEETGGFMYIKRSNLDGTSIETLLSGVDRLKGLALDLTNNKIYFTLDSSPSMIMSINIDGSGSAILFSSGSGQIGTPDDIEIPGNGAPAPKVEPVTAWAGATATGGGNNWANLSGCLGSPDGTDATTNWTAPQDNLYLKDFAATSAGEPILKVELIIQLETTTAMVVDDYLQTDVEFGGFLIGEYNLIADTLNNYYNAEGLFSIDITSFKSWNWSDFTNGSGLEVKVDIFIMGIADGQMSRIDGIGFRINNIVSEGNGDSSSSFNANTSLVPVPLKDLYNPDSLEFVSASLSPSAVDETNGVITWNNIGPIHAGNSKTVSVTFKAKEPFNNTTGSTTNTGIVYNAYFGDGDPAQNDTSSASVVIQPTGSFSGLVWGDVDQDGWQGAVGYEAGVDVLIPNVTVSLYSCTNVHTNGSCTGTETLEVTVQTNATGAYTFEGLVPALHYRIAVDETTLPGTTSQKGDPDDDPTNGSGNGGTCGTGGSNAVCDAGWKNADSWFEISVDSWGSESWDISNINFGYSINPGIFGTVWEDVNGNGIREEGENGIAGASVVLFDGGTGYVGSTDSEGNYRFANLSAGSHNISVTPSTLPVISGVWTQTAESDGSIDNSITEELTAGEYSGSHDFGFNPSGTSDIGDALFYDWNGNGIQDVSDEGISNIEISLYRDANSNGVKDDSDILIETVSTNDNGAYLFTNYPQGNYLVMVNENDPQFPNAAQTADPNESGTCISCDGTDAIPIDGSNDYLTADFGYRPLGNATIGDLIWYDANGDGISSGIMETGIPFITIYLYADFNGDNTYVVIDSTVSDGDGIYGFPGLANGNYRVVADSTDAQMPKDGSGNFYNSTTGSSIDLVIAGGSVASINGSACSGCDNNIDFGFAPKGSIGDMIFWDTNNNGTQDWNEEGIGGVSVYLCNGNVGTCNSGSAAYTTVTSTGADGNPVGWYQFSSLPQGDYTVGVETSSGILSGLSLTADPNSDGFACDDPLLISLGFDPCDNVYGTSVNMGSNFQGADFGYKPSGVMGDYVWYDQNGDGLQDEGEYGHAGDTLWVCNAPGPCSGVTAIDTAVTDYDGLYTFSDLADGTYAVTLEVPVSMTVTSGPESVGSSTVLVTLSGGTVSNIGGTGCTDCELNVDFGLELSGAFSISGTACLDDGSEDGLCNGISGETAIGSLSINLYNDDGDYLGSTTTDISGNYSFTNLPPDTYNIAMGTSLPPLDLTDLTTTSADVPAGGTITETTTSVYQTITVIANVTDADFAFKLNANVDYGDLSSSYTNISALAENGARHIIEATPTLYLGAIPPNGESDFQASTDASGDGAEEDGVVFTNVDQWKDGTVASGNGGSLDISVTGSGWLVGWIDFNLDGDFLDAGEMVVSKAVSTSTSAYAFDIPAGTFLGVPKSLYARFRVFESEPPVSEFAFGGSAFNGEVEDYYFLAGKFLPVDWLAFSVTLKGADANLSWATAQEINSDHFIIERSMDGNMFTHIGEVQAVGNSSSVSEYTYTDPGITLFPSPVFFYRLKQVGLDGKFDYSNVIELKMIKDKQFVLVVFPNPADKVVNIRYSIKSESPETKEFRALNAVGQVIHQEVIPAGQDQGEIQLNTQNWATGFYYLQLTGESGSDVVKLRVK